MYDAIWSCGVVGNVYDAIWSCGVVGNEYDAIWSCGVLGNEYDAIWSCGVVGNEYDAIWSCGVVGNVYDAIWSYNTELALCNNSLISLVVHVEHDHVSDCLLSIFLLCCFSSLLFLRLYPVPRIMFWTFFDQYHRFAWT